MEVHIWYLKSAALPKWNWKKKKNSEKKWNLNKVAAPVLSDPVTARLLTRLGADCLQKKIFLLSLVYEAKDEERHLRKGPMSQYLVINQSQHMPGKSPGRLVWWPARLLGCLQASGKDRTWKSQNYIGEDKKHKEAGTLTTRWMTKRKTKAKSKFSEQSDPVGREHYKRS